MVYIRGDEIELKDVTAGNVYGYNLALGVYPTPVQTAIDTFWLSEQTILTENAGYLFHMTHFISDTYDENALT
jgi:hypothetical protein